MYTPEHRISNGSANISHIPIDRRPLAGSTKKGWPECRLGGCSALPRRQIAVSIIEPLPVLPYTRHTQGIVRKPRRQTSVAITARVVFSGDRTGDFPIFRMPLYVWLPVCQTF